MYDITHSEKRAQSTVLTEKNGLKWRAVFNRKVLTVGKLLNLLTFMKMKDFSEIWNNGSHLSREIYVNLQE